MFVYHWSRFDPRIAPRIFTVRGLANIGGTAAERNIGGALPPPPPGPPSPPSAGGGLPGGGRRGPPSGFRSPHPREAPPLHHRPVPAQGPGQRMGQPPERYHQGLARDS